jgi:hypothetical protein
MGAGSTFSLTRPASNGPSANQFIPNLLDQNDLPRFQQQVAPKTKTAPSPTEVTEAARSLARLPRCPKLRCGWVAGKPGYRGMPVLLFGRTVFVFGCRRRKLIYTVERDGCVGDPLSAGVTWGVVDVAHVQVPKNEDAVILGRSKAGAREKRSERKIRAAQVNGCAPVRPGRRPRGRPRRV